MLDKLERMQRYDNANPAAVGAILSLSGNHRKLVFRDRAMHRFAPPPRNWWSGGHTRCRQRDKAAPFLNFAAMSQRDTGLSRSRPQQL
jgi:hypothetical protein